jgi:hypothetical protein
LPPVSTAPSSNLHWCQQNRWKIMETISDC